MFARHIRQANEFIGPSTWLCCAASSPFAEHESFALAAEQVHRTQSAVTQQMARLEEQPASPYSARVGRRND